MFQFCLIFNVKVLVTCCCLLRCIGAVGEKAHQKCLEYAKYVYVNESSPVLSATAQSHTVSKCGIVETPLIVGGQRVNENEFPHMAAIGYRSDEFNETYAWKCGGSVISPSFVLTAAHCENDRESGNPVVVKMGVIDIHDNGSNAQLINVASITSHPSYKSSEKYYDIALIKLESFIRFDEHVRPACLDTRSESWSKMIAIGFGKTQYENDNGSRHLRKVLLSFVDSATCIRTYQTFKPLRNGIIDSQLCAGEAEGKKVSGECILLCFSLRLKNYLFSTTHSFRIPAWGTAVRILIAYSITASICIVFFSSIADVTTSSHYTTGGPLQVVMKEPYCMYNIVGITSFGKFCGFANSFGVYTNVSSFIGYVENIVWP